MLFLDIVRRHRSTLALAAILSASGGNLLAAPFASNRITVRTEGVGPDVVLIPGLNSSPRVWATTVAAVPGYRYHLVQLAGFAGLAAGANQTGDLISPVGEEIVRYIEEAGLDKPAIVGHSLGGTLGILIAERHPAVLSRLMVVDMVPYLGLAMAGPNASDSAVQSFAERIAADAKKTTAEQRRQRSIMMIDSMVNNKAMRQVAIDDSLSSDALVGAHAYSEVIKTDLRPELGKIQVPVTVLFARPAITGKAWFDPVKQLTIKAIPDSAHFIMWDQPERFQTELKSFLTAN